ncbi:uncharacterized protein LOC122557072 [Chiloscyllium plagiosum]|uniref:uncharacterized protein LOC122557072 n=1 Tax=Chiloscyllium plagiosum TaxID=36176 RepID=UPI001CB836CB|nr:uncharacterized protein LOC122557072 [Chiloscyllium plagiosum]
MSCQSDVAVKQHLLNKNLLFDAQSGFCQARTAPGFVAALIRTQSKKMNCTGDLREIALGIKVPPLSTSETGLAATLMQQGQRVAFSSRTLTEMEHITLEWTKNAWSLSLVVNTFINTYFQETKQHSELTTNHFKVTFHKLPLFTPKNVTHNTELAFAHASQVTEADVNCRRAVDSSFPVKTVQDTGIIKLLLSINCNIYRNPSYSFTHPDAF